MWKMTWWVRARIRPELFGKLKPKPDPKSPAQLTHKSALLYYSQTKLAQCVTKNFSDEQIKVL